MLFSWHIKAFLIHLLPIPPATCLPKSHPHPTLFTLQAFCRLHFTVACTGSSQTPAASRLLGKLVEAQIAESHPQSFWFGRSGGGPKTAFISWQPRSAAAISSETRLWEPLDCQFILKSFSCSPLFLRLTPTYFSCLGLVWPPSHVVRRWFLTFQTGLVALFFCSSTLLVSHFIKHFLCFCLSITLYIPSELDLLLTL